MKKSITFIIALLLVLVVSACSDTENVETKSKGTENKQEEKKPEKENKSESKVGSRSNPVKINEVAIIDTAMVDDDFNEYKTKIELSIEEVIRGTEAQQKLKSMNEFNEDAPDGYEWALIKAKIKVVESETEDYPFMIDGIMYFEAVSESGDVYSGDIVGSTNPEFSFEMYNGSEKSGYMAKLVKVGEAANLQYEPNLGGRPVFFELK